MFLECIPDSFDSNSPPTCVFSKQVFKLSKHTVITHKQIQCLTYIFTFCCFSTFVLQLGIQKDIIWIFTILFTQWTSFINRLVKLCVNVCVHQTKLIFSVRITNASERLTFFVLVYVCKVQSFAYSDTHKTP